MEIFKTKCMKVEFPFYNVGEYRDKMIHPCDIDFKEGRSFISNNTDTIADIVSDVVNLLSSILVFNKKTYTKFDDVIYNCVPYKVVEFSFKSRFDSGYCLAKRCIRHAMDSHGESIVHCNAVLFRAKYSKKIGIEIEHYIPTSMKW